MSSFENSVLVGGRTRGALHQQLQILRGSDGGGARLEYGAMKYSVMNMSTVLDEDCMAKADGRDEYK